MKKILFWIFSAALVVGGTVGAMAQAEQLAKVNAPRTAHRVLSANDLVQSQELMAELQEREAAGGNTTSVLRRASFTATGCESVLTGTGLRLNTTVARTAGTAEFSPARVTETEGNLTITKDDHGIITDVTGVAAKYYTRATTGMAIYPSGSSASVGNQSGTVTIIEDGNNVYIKEPVTRYTNGAWVKGVKSGNTITIAPRQPLEYNTQYGASISLRFGLLTAGGQINAADDHAQNITFTVDGNTLTLNDTGVWDQTADVYFIGGLWDDDNSFSGYGDGATVLTYDEGYVPPSTDLVVLPDGATVENWYLNGTNVTSSAQTAINNRAAKFAKVGNDIYVAVSEEFPNSWMKGTLDGTTVTFANAQYAGNYSGNDCWFIGYNQTSKELGDMVASYDATAKTLSFTNSILVNAATDRVYYLEWLNDVVLSADEKEIVEPILTTLTSTVPYLNTLDTTEEQAEVATYDANDDGNTFTIENHETSEGTSKALRCRYNSSMPMDDWAVIPGLPLEAGKVYNISVDAASYSERYPETLQIMGGTEAKVSAFTIAITEPATVASKENVKVSGQFIPETSGTYYFAVHGMSAKDQFYLYVDNISVSEYNPAIPQAITDLAVTPDPTGEKKATVTLTMPTLNIGGTNLSGNLNLIIKVDNVESFNQAYAPGASVSTEVSVSTSGNHTFTAYVSQNGLSSEPVSTSAYVGVDTPKRPNTVSAQDKTTSVTLTWDIPTEGENGGIVKPEGLTFNVYPVTIEEFWGMTFPVLDKEHPFATGVTGNTYTFDYNTIEGDMAFTYFGVTAQTEAGESSGTLDALVTGTPYALPVMESFASGLQYFWSYAIDDVNYQDENAGLYTDKNTSSDGDGACLLARLTSAGWLRLGSGKIALAGAVNPTLTFDICAESAATVKVSVQTVAGETELTSASVSTTFSNVAVSLKDYANEPWVIVNILMESTGANEIRVDNLKVMNLLENNLALTNSFIPASMKMGTSAAVTATVANYGSAEAAGATVELLRDGAVVDSKALETMASMSLASVEFTVEATLFEPASAVYSVNVNYAADQDLSDNKSEEVSVAFKPVSNLPKVEDLAGSNVAEGVKLTWSEPNLEGGAAETKVETFESFESFAQEIEGWTFIDQDGSAVGGFQNMDVPGITPGETLASFFVWDQSVVGNQTFAAYSGTKYLAALFRYDDGQTSDWAVSPTLSGNAQTISFYARSYSEQYPERIEVYYGNGTTVSDFPAENLVLTVEAVPSPKDGDTYTWTKYEADIPAGASNFAIRSCATGSFMLMLDDITYESGSETANLSIVGYDVYRDGVKLTEQPTAECEYVDANATDGEHNYNVVVNYNKGLSPISNTATVTVSGLDNIEAGVRVSTADGCIIVAGAEGQNVVINAVNGTTIYAGTAAATTRVAVAGGVYLVKVDSVVTKVIVR